VQGLVQAQLFAERRHLLRRGKLAKQVSGHVAGRDFANQKNSYGDNEHGQKHEQ
jgi:hypothetical protein